MSICFCNLPLFYVRLDAVLNYFFDLRYLTLTSLFVRLIYTIEVRNGGYLKYVDRENHTNILRASLQGKTTTISFTVQWDYSQPYYSCFKLHRTNCTVSPIELQDVTDNVSYIHQKLSL